ncbi:hypothetical protein BN439_3563 [Erwinia amylovora Ea644]|uniref:hypothetical protein n=1 Tax=Erwinia amylovora TaxID=552 RepID=UPI0002C8D741|nr:hypothetical protein [Erwinia amylovora]CCP04586.1 hypothetical protein BN439_3563 [Erwinia amylovora Ea644]CCP08649.1 hypothetical protein BN440_3660 [Erwinia amylovora MR1]
MKRTPDAGALTLNGNLTLNGAAKLITAGGWAGNLKRGLQQEGTARRAGLRARQEGKQQLKPAVTIASRSITAV